MKCFGLPRRIAALAVNPLQRILMCVCLSATLATPAAAITWGSEDAGNAYPQVGALIWRDTITGDLFPVCSGTLIHSRVFLTAGHCSANTLYYLDLGRIEALVSFDFDVGQAAGPTLHPVASVWTHPGYTRGGTQSEQHSNDVGLLVLENPIHSITPAALPAPGFLDELNDERLLKQGQARVRYTVVGFGLAFQWPPPVFLDNTRRMIAESEHLSLKKAWLLMAQNNVATGAGGTCYGDSGGPAFFTNDDGSQVVVGVTSWGDRNCVATGIDARVDIDATLDFIDVIIQTLD